jgi:hypothetical protein
VDDDDTDDPVGVADADADGVDEGLVDDDDTDDPVGVADADADGVDEGLVDDDDTDDPVGVADWEDVDGLDGVANGDGVGSTGTAAIPRKKAFVGTGMIAVVDTHPGVPPASVWKAYTPSDVVTNAIRLSFGWMDMSRNRLPAAAMVNGADRVKPTVVVARDRRYNPIPWSTMYSSSSDRNAAARRSA